MWSATHFLLVIGNHVSKLPVRNMCNLQAAGHSKMSWECPEDEWKSLLTCYQSWYAAWEVNLSNSTVVTDTLLVTKAFKTKPLFRMRATYILLVLFQNLMILCIRNRKIYCLLVWYRMTIDERMEYYLQPVIWETSIRICCRQKDATNFLWFIGDWEQTQTSVSLTFFMVTCDII